MSAKQDRTYPRTASALEQKYKFGKSFAEVMGIAEDARDKADKASEEVEKLDKDLTAEEVYNRLTNNGTVQGLFRGENGDLYVNAEYLYALEKLFAKDIIMSGKFTHTAEVFLEPEQEELDTIQKHLLRTEIIPIDKFPLYDFNNDGDITISDFAYAKMASMGVKSLADWSGAVKTTVTLTIDLSDPYKALCMKGTNMWGREVEKYVGIGFSQIKNSADYMVEQGTNGMWTYEKWASGIAKCWGQYTETVTYTQSNNNTEWVAQGTEIPLPIEFKEVQLPKWGCWLSGWCIAGTYGLTTSTVKAGYRRLFLTDANTTHNETVSVEITGRWK